MPLCFDEEKQEENLKNESQLGLNVKMSPSTENMLTFKISSFETR